MQIAHTANLGILLGYLEDEAGFFFRLCRAPSICLDTVQVLLLRHYRNLDSVSLIALISSAELKFVWFDFLWASAVVNVNGDVDYLTRMEDVLFNRNVGTYVLTTHAYDARNLHMHGLAEEVAGRGNGLTSQTNLISFYFFNVFVNWFIEVKCSICA